MASGATTSSCCSSNWPTATSTQSSGARGSQAHEADVSGPGRYDGKPFLRLLECYVLWAAGRLPDDEAAQLDRMTPKLREIYGANGSWHDIVVAQIGATPEVTEA